MIRSGAWSARDWDDSLDKKTQKRLCFFPLCSVTHAGVIKTSPLQARKQALTEHRSASAYCSWTKSPASRAVRNKRLLFKPCCLWYFCCSNLNGQRQLAWWWNWRLPLRQGKFSQNAGGKSRCCAGKSRERVSERQ